MGKKEYKESFKNISEEQKKQDLKQEKEKSEGKEESIKSEVLKKGESDGKGNKEERKKEDKDNEEEDKKGNNQQKEEKTNNKDEIKEKPFFSGDIKKREKFFNEVSGIWKTKNFFKGWSLGYENYASKKINERDGHNQRNVVKNLEEDLKNFNTKEQNQQKDTLYNPFNTNYASSGKYNETNTFNSQGEEEDIVVPIHEKTPEKRNFFNVMKGDFNTDSNLARSSDLERNYVVRVERDSSLNDLSIVTDKGRDNFYKNKKYDIR